MAERDNPVVSHLCSKPRFDNCRKTAAAPLRMASDYAAGRTRSRLNGKTNKFGWLLACATKASSLSITSPNPATIRICMPQWRVEKVVSKHSSQIA